MSKDTFYFSHDYNARNDEKILKLRAKFGNESAYGLFWFLIESMSESPDGTLDWSDSEAIAPLSLSYGVPIDRLKNFIEYAIEIGVFNISKNRFFSKRIIDHKKFRRQFSEAGKAGAKKRWNKKNSPPISPPNAKERKGKESILNNNIYKDYNYLSNKEFEDTYKNFIDMRKKIKKPTTKQAEKLILTKLHKHNIKTAIAMLEQSTERSYTGVFEVKQQPEDTKPTSKYTKEQITEINRKKHIELYGE